MDLLRLSRAACFATLAAAALLPKLPMADDCTMPIEVDSVVYCSVSMYAIIANPSQHHGQAVQVVGYLKFEMDSAVIGPSLEAVRGAIILPDVVLVEVKEKDKAKFVELDEELVAVYGTFIYDRSGDRGLLIDKHLLNINEIHRH